MSKFSFLRRFVPLQPLQPLLLVETRVEALFSQSRGTVEALFSSMVRRISPLKRAVFFTTSRGCRGSFPNSSQENRDLREGNENSPVIHEFPDSYDLGDEYDEEDYDEYLSEEDWQALMDDEEEEIKSWQQRAVDEAIDEEEPGAYPPGDVGDIPW